MKKLAIQKCFIIPSDSSEKSITRQSKQWPTMKRERVLGHRLVYTREMVTSFDPSTNGCPSLLHRHFNGVIIYVWFTTRASGPGTGLQSACACVATRAHQHRLHVAFRERVRGTAWGSLRYIQSRNYHFCIYPGAPRRAVLSPFFSLSPIWFFLSFYRF